MKLNKGEWSEFYIGLLLLETKRVPLYKSEQIITVNSISFDNKNFSCKVDHELLKDLKQNITSQKGVFQLDHKEAIADFNFSKGTSNEKADLFINYILQGSRFTDGFSVKSKISSKPTILNASKKTNFIFQLSNIRETWRDLKAKELVSQIPPKTVKFLACSSQTFTKNMHMVDSNMDEILSRIVWGYYAKKASTIIQLIEAVYPQEQHIKIKKRVADFLYYITVGMFPSIPWDGKEDAVGCIILEKNQDLYALHRIEMNQFKTYLILNTKLETASTSRHDFGKVYQADNSYFLKLNLQIRMT